MVAVSKDTDIPVSIIKEVKDPNNLFPYTTNNVVDLVNKALKKDNILIKKMKGKEEISAIFTKTDFQLVLQFYNVKKNPELCFHYNVANRYSYASKIVDKIVDLIKKDPDNFVYNLKEGIKKDNPRHM